MKEVFEDMTFRLLLVDDHPVVRQGLIHLINQEEGLSICGEADDTNQALKALEDLNPDMVIVDISLNNSNGLELIKDIKVRNADLPILVLSIHDESLYAERSLRAGARGYIMKKEPPEKMIEAIHSVLNGEIYISKTMASRMLHSIFARGSDTGDSSLKRLSDRELEVFQFIGLGRGTRDIADICHLSIKTIETYYRNIKRKLNIRKTSELVQQAVLWVESGQNYKASINGPGDRRK